MMELANKVGMHQTHFCRNCDALREEATRGKVAIGQVVNGGALTRMVETFM
jgi:hypothetical protein